MDPIIYSLIFRYINNRIKIKVMVESGSLKEYVVNNIIGLINEMELDGETIQDILEQTGMDEQMFKQLSVKYNSK